MNRWARLACTLVMAAVLGAPASALAAPTVSQVRLAGTSRYDTMAGIVRMGFPTTSEWAVVATGSNFPDALAASALAGVKRCPVVLTDSDALSSQAASQLKRLQTKKVYLMGGEGAISAEVEDAIRNEVGATVTRLAGANRIDTSLETFIEVRSFRSDSDTVVIATSHGYADALSIGPYCYATCSPILLTQSDGTLSNGELSMLKNERRITRAVVVGGPLAVSSEVETQLKGLEVVRLEGQNRYATSKAIVEWETKHGLGWSTVGIATGRAFPDALAGAALLGSASSPLLLADGVADPTVTLAQANREALSKAYILGGPQAVSDSLSAATIGVAKADNEATRQMFEPLIREQASGAATEEGHQLALYRYANVYGDANNELLCVTKDAQGSGWTLQIHTYANGTVRKMGGMGFYGDVSYRFYPDTGAFELSCAGHGGESVTYCVAENGTYRIVATKTRQTAQDSAWKYTNGSKEIDEAEFDARIAGLARGDAVALGPSSTWDKLVV